MTTPQKMQQMVEACREHLTLDERAIVARAIDERLDDVLSDEMMAHGGRSVSPEEFAQLLLASARRALEQSPAGGFAPFTDEPRAGSIYWRALDETREVVVYPLTFGEARLCVGVRRSDSWERGYVYSSRAAAVHAAEQWNGAGDPLAGFIAQAPPLREHAENEGELLGGPFAQAPKQPGDGPITIARLPDGMLSIAVEPAVGVRDIGSLQVLKLSEHNAAVLFGALSLMLGIRLPARIGRAIRLRDT